MIKLKTLYVILLAFVLSCGSGASESDSQAESVSAGEEASALDQFLEENGFESVNSINELNETPLQLASKNGDLEIVALLIDNGAELDAPGVDGSTPLSCAALKGHLEVVQLLVQEGADVNCRAENRSISETPLHMAAGKGYTEIVEILLNAGADIEARGIAGMTPLHMAAGEGQLPVLGLLIEKGANLEALSTNPQFSPLQTALRTENYPAAAMLLENGANDDPLFMLDNSTAGLFSVGMNESDIPDIAAAYGDVTVEEVDLMLEGMSSPAIEMTFPGDSSPGLILEIEPGQGNVYRIKVLNDRFRTEDGIGVSSTVADVRELYDFQDVYFGEGGDPFVFVDDLEASMILVPGDWWVMGELQGDLPSETEVAKILIL